MSMRVFSQIALLAVLTGSWALADDWSRAFPVTGKPELRVETDDGSVTVRTGDEHRISAHVVTVGWRIGLDEVEVHESHTANRVELVVRRPHRHFGIDFGNRSIRVEVQVPRQIDADLRTGDGHIDVQGIEGETRLRTADGAIDADSLGGSLRAETGDGHVRVRGRLQAMTLHTGDGSIDAAILPGSKMNESWRVSTGDGSVTLRVPRDFGADLDVHTGDGHISMDLPAITRANSGGDHDRRARINGGGLPFSISTNDGSIRIGVL